MSRPVYKSENTKTTLKLKMNSVFRPSSETSLQFHIKFAGKGSAVKLLRRLLILTTRCDGQPVLLHGQYSYSLRLQQYYSAEYEYTIHRPK